MCRHFAPVRPLDAVDDGEAEAGAAGLRLAPPPERLPDRIRGVAETRPAVAHADRRAGADPDLDRAAAVDHRVLDEVGDRQLDLVGEPACGARLGIDHEGQIGAARDREGCELGDDGLGDVF